MEAAEGVFGQFADTQRAGCTDDPETATELERVTSAPGAVYAGRRAGSDRHAHKNPGTRGASHCGGGEVQAPVSAAGWNSLRMLVLALIGVHEGDIVADFALRP